MQSNLSVQGLLQLLIIKVQMIIDIFPLPNVDWSQLYQLQDGGLNMNEWRYKINQKDKQKSVKKKPKRFKTIETRMRNTIKVGLSRKSSEKHQNKAQSFQAALYEKFPKYQDYGQQQEMDIIWQESRKKIQRIRQQESIIVINGFQQAKKKFPTIYEEKKNKIGYTVLYLVSKLQFYSLSIIGEQFCKLVVSCFKQFKGKVNITNLLQNLILVLENKSNNNKVQIALNNRKKAIKQRKEGKKQKKEPLQKSTNKEEVGELEEVEEVSEEERIYEERLWKAFYCFLYTYNENKQVSAEKLLETIRTAYQQISQQIQDRLLIEKKTRKLLTQQSYKSQGHKTIDQMESVVVSFKNNNSEMYDQNEEHQLGQSQTKPKAQKNQSTDSVFTKSQKEEHQVRQSKRKSKSKKQSSDSVSINKIHMNDVSSDNYDDYVCPIDINKINGISNSLNDCDDCNDCLRESYNEKRDFPDISSIRQQFAGDVKQISQQAKDQLLAENSIQKLNPQQSQKSSGHKDIDYLQSRVVSSMKNNSEICDQNEGRQVCQCQRKAKAEQQIKQSAEIFLEFSYERVQSYLDIQDLLCQKTL